MQGKHTDRLMTISYLPVNLVVIAALVRWHAHVHTRLRILSGLAGFTLAVSAVPLVRRFGAAGNGWMCVGGQATCCRASLGPSRGGPPPPFLVAPQQTLAWQPAPCLAHPLTHLCTLLVQLGLAPASTGNLAAVLLLVAACGACDGIAQGALFGEAALLPPKYTQALVSGTAVSGTGGRQASGTAVQWSGTFHPNQLGMSAARLVH